MVVSFTPQSIRDPKNEIGYMLYMFMSLFTYPYVTPSEMVSMIKHCRSLIPQYLVKEFNDIIKQKVKDYYPNIFFFYATDLINGIASIDDQELWIWFVKHYPTLFCQPKFNYAGLYLPNDKRTIYINQDIYADWLAARQKFYDKMKMVCQSFDKPQVAAPKLNSTEEKIDNHNFYLGYTNITLMD